MIVQFQVSNGAECVLIKKSWFLQHANESTLRKLRNLVSIQRPVFPLYYHKNIILIIMQGLLMQLQNEKYDGLTDKIEWTEKKIH